MSKQEFDAVALHQEFCDLRKKIDHKIQDLLKSQPDQLKNYRNLTERDRKKPWIFPTDALREVEKEIQSSSWIEIQEDDKRCTEIYNVFWAQYNVKTRTAIACEYNQQYLQSLIDDVNHEFWSKKLKGKFHLWDCHHVSSSLKGEKQSRCMEETLWQDCNPDISPWLAKLASNFAKDYRRCHEGHFRMDHPSQSPVSDDDDSSTSDDDFSNSHQSVTSSEKITKLQQLIDVLTHLEQVNRDPAEIVSYKELLVGVYCSIELTFFGEKLWQEAWKVLEKDRDGKDYFEYLQELSQKNVESLTYKLLNISSLELSDLKPYYPYCIRSYIFEDKTYIEIAQEMGISKHIVKDRTQKALDLLEVTLKKFSVNLLDYFDDRPIALEKIMIMVFKLLAVPEKKYAELLQSWREDPEIETLRAKYGMKGIALKEPRIQKKLQEQYWEPCFCSYKYCWKYLESILSGYYQKQQKADTIYKEIPICQHLIFANFEEFRNWFQGILERFREILSQFGFSLETGTVYHRWILRKRRLAKEEEKMDDEQLAQ